MPHSQSLTLTDHLDTDDHVHVFRASSNDTFAYVEVVENGSTACSRITRAQAHELHAHLGEILGMTHPTPSSPLTASKAAVGGTKASRNHSWDVV